MSDTANKDTTHFGFKEVGTAEKEGLVRGVFDSVSGNYDIMNDVMSFGLHRLWKYVTISLSGARKNQAALDIAAGTCDISQKLKKAVGKEGRVVALDINHSMLLEGRDKLIDANQFKGVEFVQASAEALPLQDNTFQVITIGFGLRNVTNQDNALKEMYRVLQPGGQCLILEFSEVKLPVLKQLYDAYSFNVIPRFGQLIANDKDSYQYLVESIRKHPNQETLSGMMQEAGFDSVKVHNFLGGVVALHRGYKY